jgi:hypothetical protein
MLERPQDDPGDLVSGLGVPAVGLFQQQLLKAQQSTAGNSERDVAVAVAVGKK